MGKHKVQHSDNPNLMKKTSATGAATKVSVVKLSMKTMPNETPTKTKLKKKRNPTKGRAIAISNKKTSGEKMTLGKLNAYTIDWTDFKVKTLETMKYLKANNIERTQESINQVILK